MRGTVNWWAGWSIYRFTDSWSLTSVGHRVATLLDSTRLFRLFSRHISRTQSFQQNRHINFHALLALKLLVSLISRLVACSARIVVDKQTDRQTDTQTNYCNPRCACAPRVNYSGAQSSFSNHMNIVDNSNLGNNYICR